MLKKDIILFLSFAMVWLMAACQDDDSFTTSPSNLLTFSTDTVKLDTLFSNVPSAAKTLWAFNRSGDGLRCTSIRLERGAQSGFRVNVDGIYLGEDNDYSTNEVEVRNKDCIRVFIEATLPTASIATPEEQSDNLIFTLESGVEQRVNLVRAPFLDKRPHLERSSRVEKNHHMVGGLPRTRDKAQLLRRELEGVLPLGVVRGLLVGDK